jgi:hypothetical protein
MLPIGILYFMLAFSGLSVGVAFIALPFVQLADRIGWFGHPGELHTSPEGLASPLGWPLTILAGIVILTLVMHAARGVGRVHAAYAKALLVSRAA